MHYLGIATIRGERGGGERDERQRESIVTYSKHIHLQQNGQAIRCRIAAALLVVIAVVVVVATVAGGMDVAVLVQPWVFTTTRTTIQHL
jgi:hypothetical protein